MPKPLLWRLIWGGEQADAQGRAEERIAGPVEAQDADTNQNTVAHHLRSSNGSAL